MITPRERYENDARYRRLVATLEAEIHRGHFSPPEIAEAATYAAIRYESERGLRGFAASERFADMLKVIDGWEDVA